ncbi:DMT family protein [Snodgrassella sp. CFCC 13594]|uniref:DMT family protein n=1 Tax=Snodgrassella sp. CFCC 13594 TaxID=1775559 RepID=UPI00082DD1A1|nr:DMT family protein [Snodgrassella sp. CFCC 13594]
MRWLSVIGLLSISNLVMTIAWYWHIKPNNQHFPIWQIILISWGLAFFEYCFAVPANHLGAQWHIKPFQLKIIQEVITLTIFALFAIFYLKDSFKLNYLVSFVLMLGAVYFAFKK